MTAPVKRLQKLSGDAVQGTLITSPEQERITEASYSRQGAINARFIKQEYARSYTATVTFILAIVSTFFIDAVSSLHWIAIALLGLVAFADWLKNSETIRYPKGKALREYESKLEAEYNRYFDEMIAAGAPLDKGDIKSLLDEKLRFLKRQ